MKPTPWIVVALLLCAAGPAAAASCPRGFERPERVVRTDVESAVYGDFDGDGRVDIAITQHFDTTSILLNRGSVFEPIREQYSTTGNLAAAVDQDGDGNLDLIYVATGLGPAVAFGHGDGSFAEAVLTDLNPGITEPLLADLDGDGHLEAIAFGYDDGALIVFRTRADGIFEQVAEIAVDSSPDELLAGDLDGDGKIDLVAVNDDSYCQLVFTFLWNEGNLTFVSTRATGPHNCEERPEDFAVADIEGDGRDELIKPAKDKLIVVRGTSRSLAIEELAFTGLSDEVELAGMIDFDGDSFKDLVFRSAEAAGVMRGSPGGLAAPVFFSLPGSWHKPALVDIDGDGLGDILASNGGSGLALVRGARPFNASGATRVFAIGEEQEAYSMSVLRADVNGDGVDDLVDIARSSMSVDVLIGDGHGSFHALATQHLRDRSELSLQTSTAIGDFDDDGHIDLAIEGEAAAAAVHFGDGSGAFGPAKASLPIDRLIGLARTDTGRDSLIGIAAGKIVQIILNGRDPVVRSIRDANTRVGSEVLLADADGDGDTDLLLDGNDDVTELVVQSHDLWISTLTLPKGEFEMRVDSADLNHDGRFDLLIWDSTSYEVWLGTSGGGFQLHTWGHGTASITDIQITDFDRDGLLDLLVDSPGFYSGQVIVLHRNVGGGLFEPAGFALAGSGSRMAVIDADRDGWNDVAIGVRTGVEILRNACATPAIDVEVVGRVSEDTPLNFVVTVDAPTDAIGLITIAEGASVLYESGPTSYGLATLEWTSPPLAKGRHVFTLSYEDQYAGRSERTFTMDVPAAPSRTRSVRH
jgi:VCBS repeat protein